MSLLLALSIGCATGPYGAPLGATIERIEGDADAGPIFDVAYNDPDDGVGLLIREQVKVTMEEDERDMPLNNILVEVISGWSAAYLIPSTAVSTVDDYEDACEGDGSAECGAWFDIGEERYVEFAGEYTDLGGHKPGFLSAGTDNRGVLEFYVFIDSIPVDDDGEVIQIPLDASIGVDAASWSYDFE